MEEHLLKRLAPFCYVDRRKPDPTAARSSRSATTTGMPTTATRRSAARACSFAQGSFVELFLTSLLTKIAVTSRRLLEYGETITRVAAAVLVLVGLGAA